jgi:hypothetical protein
MWWYRSFKRCLARWKARQRSSPGFWIDVLRHLSRGKRGVIAAVNLHEVGLASGQRLFGRLHGTKHLAMAGNFPLHRRD